MFYQFMQCTGICMAKDGDVNFVSCRESKEEGWHEIGNRCYQTHVFYQPGFKLNMFAQKYMENCSTGLRYIYIYIYICSFSKVYILLICSDSGLDC